MNCGSGRAGRVLKDMTTYLRVSLFTSIQLSSFLFISLHLLVLRIFLLCLLYFFIFLSLYLPPFLRSCLLQPHSLPFSLFNSSILLSSLSQHAAFVHLRVAYSHFVVVRPHLPLSLCSAFTSCGDYSVQWECFALRCGTRVWMLPHPAAPVPLPRSLFMRVCVRMRVCTRDKWLLSF